MKKLFGRWLCLLMVTALACGMSGIALAEETADHQVGIFTVTVPADWAAEGDGSAGMLQWQFTDDGSMAICVMTANNVGGVSQLMTPVEYLKQVAEGMGVGEYELQTLGGRDVLVCDVDQSGLLMSAAIFMEGDELGVILAYVIGAQNTDRQREIACMVAETVIAETGEQTVAAEKTASVADGEGNMLHTIGNFTVSAPADWTVINEDITGQLQMQIMDGGQIGVFVLVPTTLGGGAQTTGAKAIMEATAEGMGITEYEIDSIGGRDVLVCDFEQSGMKMSVCILIDGDDMAIMTVYLLGAEDTARQRELVKELTEKVKRIGE